MSLSISLTIVEVEQRLNRLGIPCRFTVEERGQLSTTPVVDPNRGFFVYPTPVENSALTLAGVRSIVGTDPSRQPSIFDHPWYANEAFMTTPCVPGWHQISMDVMLESVNQQVDYIRRLSDAEIALPTAIEVVLMLFLHYEGTGEQLLLRKHTWCSDLASLGRHVTVGAFGRNGVFISGHPMGFASRGLGACAKLATHSGHLTTEPTGSCG